MTTPNEIFYKVTHHKIRTACGQQIVETYNTALNRGIPETDLVVGLTHIDEALIPEEARQDMRARGIEVGCLLLTRRELADNIKDFIHPETKASCYKDIAIELEKPQLPKHFYVAVFAQKNASLTRVKVG